MRVFQLCNCYHARKLIHRRTQTHRTTGRTTTAAKRAEAESGWFRLSARSPTRHYVDVQGCRFNSGFEFPFGEDGDHGRGPTQMPPKVTEVLSRNARGPSLPCHSKSQGSNKNHLAIVPRWDAIGFGGLRYAARKCQISRLESRAKSVSKRLNMCPPGALV